MLQVLSDACKKVKILADNGPGNIPVAFVTMMDTMIFGDNGENSHE